MVEMGHTEKERTKMPPYNTRTAPEPNIGSRERVYPEEWEFGFPENVGDLLESYDGVERDGTLPYTR